MSIEEGNLQVKAVTPWFDKLNNVFISFEFSTCHSKHSVFACKTKLGHVILIVHVDDIIIFGKLDGIEDMKNKLEESFKQKIQVNYVTFWVLT